VAVVQEWVAQCHGVDTGLTAQLPYSARDSFTGRVGGTAPGYDSQAVSEGRRGGDSPFDSDTHGVQEHLMLWPEEWAWRHGPAAASSEAENHPRGALGPRARQTVARGSVNPSSKAENCSRGIAAGSVGGPL
jgi:hypothetical protein